MVLGVAALDAVTSPSGRVVPMVRLDVTESAGAKPSEMAPEGKDICRKHMWSYAGRACNGEWSCAVTEHLVCIQDCPARTGHRGITATAVECPMLARCGGGANMKELMSSDVRPKVCTVVAV